MAAAHSAAAAQVAAHQAAAHAASRDREAGHNTVGQSANYKSNVSVNRDVVHVHHRSRSSSKANLHNDVEAAMAAAATRPASALAHRVPARMEAAWTVGFILLC